MPFAILFLKPTLKTVYGLEYESGGKRYKYRMGFMKPNLLLNKNKKKVEKGPGVLLWSILLASIWGIVEIVDPLGNHVPYIYAILYRWRYIFIVKHFYLDSSVCVQKKEKKILSCFYFFFSPHQKNDAFCGCFFQTLISVQELDSLLFRFIFFSSCSF